VIAQEGCPLLASWLVGANRPHILLNGSLAHPKAQFQQLPTNALSTEDGDCFPPSRLLKAMVSAATCGLWEEVFDFRFQYRRKGSRGPREPRVWLHDQQGLLPSSNEPDQQDEEDAIGPGERWPLHLSPENDERFS